MGRLLIYRRCDRRIVDVIIKIIPALTTAAASEMC
jgi:hypothetical protein